MGINNDYEEWIEHIWQIYNKRHASSSASSKKPGESWRSLRTVCVYFLLTFSFFRLRSSLALIVWLSAYKINQFKKLRKCDIKFINKSSSSNWLPSPFALSPSQDQCLWHSSWPCKLFCGVNRQGQSTFCAT